jgi:PiT family inorganic phosphate transporter
MGDASVGILILIIALTVGFGLVNGFNDAANAVAASVGSRAISPRNAMILAAVCNLAGAATGLEVAKTIGKGILVEEEISFLIITAALGAVIIWGTIATYYGLPVSITHSFVAGFGDSCI